MPFVIKTVLYTIVGLLVIISLYFIGLSISSRKQPELGLVHNQLRACPATPNCVSSEQQGSVAYIEPLKVTTTVNNAWHHAKSVVVGLGGSIVTEHDGYLHAQFITTILRYIDDVELRLDESNRLIHVRSASRVGRSDLGANRARVEKIRTAFQKNAAKE